MTKSLTDVNKVDSHSFELIKRAEYAAALEVIQALETPSSYDIQNAGICLWGMGKLSDALEWMYRARASGLEVAKVDIAALQHLQGRNDLALSTLETIDSAQLSPFERVRGLYTHAEILRLNESLNQSIVRFQEAWYACQICDDTDRREPIATSLALAMHAQGDERAEKWLERAEKHVVPMRRTQIKLQKAIMSSFSGQHKQGRKLLSEITLEGQMKFNKVLYHYLEGLVLTDDADKAIAALERAAVESTGMEVREFEILARLRISALELKRGQTASARAQLARIERLPMSRVNASEWKMRRGNVANAEGNAELARRLTSEATSELKSLEYHREYAWAQLSLARVEINHGSDAGQRLDELADTCQFIGLKLLSSELSVTPQLEQLPQYCSDYALQSLGLTRKAQKQGVKRYDLKLFGDAELHADGRAVRLRSVRMLDLIAYLHTHPEAKLDEVIASVFNSTTDRQSAQNHFAQLRHLVGKQLPGLHIEPNKRLKTYRLHSDIAFESDFERAQTLLASGDGQSLKAALALRTGPLLRDVEGEWASELRSELDHRYTKAGFRAMARLYDEGNVSDALEIGERLLEVDPFDRMVAAYCVEIVRELHGAWAARQQLEGYIALYRDEQLPAPENLLALRNNLTAIN